MITLQRTMFTSQSFENLQCPTKVFPPTPCILDTERVVRLKTCVYIVLDKYRLTAEFVPRLHGV